QRGCRSAKAGGVGGVGRGGTWGADAAAPAVVPIGGRHDLTPGMTGGETPEAPPSIRLPAGRRPNPGQSCDLIVARIGGVDASEWDRRYAAVDLAWSVGPNAVVA